MGLFRVAECGAFCRSSGRIWEATSPTAFR